MKLTKNATVLSSKWVMKKKDNGTHCAHITPKGYEQVNGEHKDEHSIAAPVVDDMTIHLILVLKVMAGWIPQLVDVRRAFLHGEFEGKDKMYMKVPQGFEKRYGRGVVLMLLKVIYGTKQAASSFRLLLQSVYLKLSYKRSNADPCMFDKWSEKDWLVVWLSWVVDCLCTGKKESVEEVKEEFKKEFEVDDIGPLEEYVGCKIDYDPQQIDMKLT